MPDTNGAAARRWRSGIPARFTAVAAALFVLLSGLLIAAAAHEVRASATGRAVKAAVAAVDGAAGDLARDGDAVDVLASLRARPDVVEAYLLADDGAVLAGAKPPAEQFAADASSAKPYDAVTLGDDAVHISRNLSLPGGGRSLLHVAVSLADAAAETARAVAGGLLAALVFLAFALPAFGLVVDRTMAPLRALARAAVRDGDAPADVIAAAGRRDEIGALARAHLAMARSLSRNDDVVRRLTFDDPLTRLPNREALRRRLADGLQVGETAALLKIGVSGLGRIATGLGPAANDLAVRGAADRLRQAAVEWSRGGQPGAPLWGGRTVFLARIGEAEFAILAERAAAEAGQELARLALDAFAEPLDVDDHPVTLGVSIGVALAPVHGDDVHSLMRSAGTALASARAAGNRAVRVAGVELNDNAYGRLRIEQELRRAIPNGELEVHYQPQIELGTGRVTGAEALVRWRHPTRGLVPPDRFIPVAEETGLVEPLGRFVLEEASRKAAAWAETGLHARIAVNVSALQFRNPRFAEATLGLIRGAGCDPNLIELEITESMAMADAGHAARELAPLRAAGVRIAIDDFGTGYSNLASLTQLPFDVLKIDRGFVRDALQKPNARVVVAAVLGLASALGVETVAEGVETEDQRAFVAGHGCTLAQGYLFARPMPADAFEAWRQARLTAELRALYERALAMAPAGARASAASVAG